MKSPLNVKRMWHCATYIVLSHTAGDGDRWIWSHDGMIISGIQHSGRNLLLCQLLCHDFNVNNGTMITSLYEEGCVSTVSILVGVNQWSVRGTVHSFIHSFIHLVVCLTRGPKPLPKRAVHIVRSRASSFNWQYALLSLRSSSSFLRLLPHLPVTSIPHFIFPSITRCRKQFLRKMWPIQLTLILLMWRIGWAHNNARK